MSVGGGDGERGSAARSRGKRSQPYVPVPADDLDPAHDPGFAIARDRADLHHSSATPIITASGSRIRVGIAAWTEKTLTAGEIFYPPGTDSAAERLRFYASRFSLAEVDSSYYALPTRAMAELWVERTPDDFVFDIKAHALMTGHPTEPVRLPRELRDALPRALATATRVYAKDLPPEVLDAVWAVFRDAIEPLRAAGKLGAVLLQYPRWFVPSRANAAELVRARERLGGAPVAVELRNSAWLEGRVAARTFELLREHALPYVIVDEPQIGAGSVPSTVAVTSPELAIVRLHGRRAETWQRAGTPVVEKYRYLYDAGQLAEWVPAIRQVASAARETHVVFNNCYGNYGTTNAAEMATMLRNDRA